MAFRDQTEVFREKLDAAEKELAALRQQHAALRSQQMPAVRGLTLALGVVVVLGAGIAWHLGTTNRGLDAEARAQQANVAALRAELDRANATRAEAELASVANEAACRERTELEIARARDRVAEAVRSTRADPPTAASPARYFWIRAVTGREDLTAGDPCLVTLARTPALHGQGECRLEAACGADGSVPLIPEGPVPCTPRADGWVDAELDDGSLRAVMRGPQLGVRDAAGTWTVMLANERPCL